MNQYWSRQAYSTQTDSEQPRTMGDETYLDSMNGISLIPGFLGTLRASQISYVSETGAGFQAQDCLEALTGSEQAEIYQQSHGPQIPDLK